MSVDARTKNVVRSWAGMPPGSPLSSADKIDPLRPNSRDQLHLDVNVEFKPNEGQFPISVTDWNAAQPTISTVGELRDFISTHMVAA